MEISTKMKVWRVKLKPTWDQPKCRKEIPLGEVLPLGSARLLGIVEKLMAKMIK